MPASFPSSLGGTAGVGATALAGAAFASPADPTPTAARRSARQIAKEEGRRKKEAKSAGCHVRGGIRRSSFVIRGFVIGSNLVSCGFPVTRHGYGSAFFL